MEKIYKTLATLLTQTFIKSSIIQKENEPVYLYGFEILLSNTVYTIVFIITALLTHTFKVSMVFWIGFYILRTIAGGYHAKTYISCHILFFINHILFIAVFYFTNVTLQLKVSVIMILIAAVLVILLAPVDHPNKRFIKGEMRRFKLLSYLYVTFVLFVAVILYSMNVKFTDYLISFAIGTLSAAISLLSAKIINNKEVKNK